MRRDDVIAVMKAGARLHIQHGKRGPKLWLVAEHLPVKPYVGQMVLGHSCVVSAKDELIEGETAQTYIYLGATNAK